MHLLIADDSPQVRNTLKRLVARMPGNIDIKEAGTVNNAVESITINKPSVAILDYKFPDGTGLDIVKEAKAYLKNTTIVIFTLFNSKSLEEKAIKNGVARVFSKSTEFPLLYHFLEKALSERLEE